VPWGNHGRVGALAYDRSMAARFLPRRGLPTFAILVVVGEIVGRALTGHVDRALHVEPLARSGASYYPFLLVAVKIVGALTLAAVLARATRAWAAADAGGRLLTALGHDGQRAPRLRPGLSPRVWVASFASTSCVYLMHTDIEGIANGRWPLFSPWLHTYALPIFAVLAVAVAALWRVAGWLYEVEDYAERTIERARKILTAALHFRTPHPRAGDESAPRRRFGLAFESRPPPLPA
jgi:hypothetical protein